MRGEKEEKKKIRRKGGEETWPCSKESAAKRPARLEDFGFFRAIIPSSLIISPALLAFLRS